MRNHFRTGLRDSPEWEIFKACFAFWVSVMTSLGLTGQVECKRVVSGSASGWSSLCNYASSAQSKDVSLRRVLFCRGNHGRLFQQNRSIAARRDRQLSGSCGTHTKNCGTHCFLTGNKKPRRSLIYGVSNSGGRGRNRTGVGGFAIRCITILLLGLKTFVVSSTTTNAYNLDEI